MIQDLWYFFRQLPSGEREFVVIPGAAHALSTARNRAVFWHAGNRFSDDAAAVSVG